MRVRANIATTCAQSVPIEMSARLRFFWFRKCAMLSAASAARQKMMTTAHGESGHLMHEPLTR
jgi:hypothetical protein